MDKEQNLEGVRGFSLGSFAVSWEQRKLGDVCQVTMGQSPDGSTYSDTPSDYILVQGNADLRMDGFLQEFGRHRKRRPQRLET